MPEIAEVEIIRRDLQPYLGHILKQIKCLDPKLTLDYEQIRNKSVISLRRHGKLLGLDFDSGSTLAIHLRLTGGLRSWLDEEARAILHFQPESVLSLLDPRRFATMSLLETNGFVGKMGPDLFDSTLTAEILLKRTSSGRGKKAIKAVLLDQTILAGMGNYLVDETLWRVKLNPRRPVGEITLGVWDDILNSARNIANRSIELGGMSFSDFRRLDGSRGEMSKELRCYRQAGKICGHCRRTLIYEVVAGRGTTFCPFCQV